MLCPYLEKSNSRCSAHLNMWNITQTFAHCAGEYGSCPVYQELRTNSSKDEHISYIPVKVAIAM